MAPLVNIEGSYGSLFLGVIASIGLMGITTMQTWIYWLKYSKRDRVGTKTSVLVLWCLEFIRACFAVHAVYHYVVVEWGDPEALGVNIWSFNIYVPLNSSIQIMVHSFFAYRVKVLSRNNWYLVGLIMILAVANLAANLALYVEITLAQELSKIQGSDKLGNLATIGLASSIAADVSITFSLLFYVNRFRAHIEEKRTLRLINRIMFYLINVGALTSMIDIATLVLCDALTNPPNLKFYALAEVTGNLYANSLLATLNARDSLKTISEAETTPANPASVLVFARAANSSSALASVGVEDVNHSGGTNHVKVSEK
ncbi:hypothetical protein BDP27DRAFT_1426252 [Rhodocollybia butyracea]|uniref:DUF6534 domain-containing protein n=1 Tax=Rhodocollybia butyracea TaxID=206335 RepID=A0A9P5PIS4_9AGAR|nr:hypothetical protein BDP27DRAFT_1426252 [Rhodocollybia butyracea]